MTKNKVKMCTTKNEGKSAVVEGFIRTSKNKIYKQRSVTSNFMYIDRLDEKVDKYNKTYDRTVKLKPVDF